MSNWTGNLSDSQLQCFRREGIGYLIAGTQRPVITAQQLEAARKAELAIAAYVYLYFADPIEPQIQQARQAIAEFRDIMLWLDVEDSASGRAPAQVVEKIREAVRLCEEGSVPWGIYTSRSKWLALTRDCQEFSHAQLWDAWYTGEVLSRLSNTAAGSNQP